MGRIPYQRAKDVRLLQVAAVCGMGAHRQPPLSAGPLALRAAAAPPRLPAGPGSVL